MTAATRRSALPTLSMSPGLTPRRPTSATPIQTVPGLGPPSTSRSGEPIASTMRMRPRSGKPLVTALISARFTPPSADTMLGNVRVCAIASPRRCASSANSGASGLSPITTRSPPSNSFACWSSAACTRSAKNPTVVTLATAMKSASSSTRSSPADQFRRSIRIASGKVFILEDYGHEHRGHRGITEERQNLNALRARAGLATNQAQWIRIFLCGSSVSSVFMA